MASFTLRNGGRFGEATQRNHGRNGADAPSRRGIRADVTAVSASLDDPIAIRAAQPDDVPTLRALIAQSADRLSRDYYDAQQIAAAIDHVFGVDSQLVADGTYLLAQDGPVIVGCGGWSRRRTLFGGDQFAARDEGLLEPGRDAAKIRAFFTHPDHARRGIAARLLAACEAAAQEAGFDTVELMATLPGVPFYVASGFVADAPIAYPAGDVSVPFVPMTKRLNGVRTNGRPAAIRRRKEGLEAEH